MKIAYFDCSSGISGDMCLGALIDAGVPVKKLEKELRKLHVKGYKLISQKVKRAGFRATKVGVIENSKLKVQSSKKWSDIERIIKASSLSESVKQKGLKIFKGLFEAEAKVHGETFDKAHLHELGAVDCLVDIMGTLICLELLGIEEAYASPVNLGSGFVKTKHGILSVPAPATIEILRCKVQDAGMPRPAEQGRGCKIYSNGTPFELTTPTGAVILKELSSGFGNMPDMIVESIGVGTGNKDFKEKANVLRVFIGESRAARVYQPSAPAVTIIETTIDDMNPQIYEYVMERLFKAGALDVYLTQLIMKKGRPGIKLTVLCNGKDKDNLMKIIFEETTTIGLRFYEANRKTLDREIKQVKTKFGKVSIKVSRLGNMIVRRRPEYEDCKKLAKKMKMPLVEVLKTASKVS
ncbi:MAG: nickel pincer cofactor biosynthesis protein LarC [Thermodesulfovibrionales bacterium]|nr:nickel pincer cofactor biosynthesis protein LarC [Thermodesulfovibrionales bacterium]